MCKFFIVHVLARHWNQLCFNGLAICKSKLVSIFSVLCAVFVVNNGYQITVILSPRLTILYLGQEPQIVNWNISWLSLSSRHKDMSVKNYQKIFTWMQIVYKLSPLVCFNRVLVIGQSIYSIVNPVIHNYWNAKEFANTHITWVMADWQTWNHLHAVTQWRAVSSQTSEVIANYQKSSELNSLWVLAW